MNKYQKYVSKHVKKIIKEEENKIHEKYPIQKNHLRPYNHLLEMLEVTSGKHFRETRRKLLHGEFRNK